jgi:hypothetical protein
MHKEEEEIFKKNIKKCEITFVSFIRKVMCLQN